MHTPSTAGTGISGVAFLVPNTDSWRKTLHLSFNFGIATHTLNVGLNLFATTSIIIRLLIHRRSVITALGTLVPSQLIRYPLRISTILLESAVLNVPIAILTIFMVGFELFYTVTVVQIMIPVQVRFLIQFRALKSVHCIYNFLLL